jgi:hypothetical protein
MGIAIDEETLESVYEGMQSAEHIAIFSDEELLHLQNRRR